MTATTSAWSSSKFPPAKNCFIRQDLGEIEPHVLTAMQNADCLLVDGTFWTEDEMISQGLGKKKAADMGHLPQSGEGGMIEILNQLPNARKILIHINNSNPILDEDSEPCKILADCGIEIAYDGLEINL